FVEDRTVAIDVMREGHTWAQVDTSEDVAVVPDALGTVAPGGGGVEAVVAVLAGRSDVLSGKPCRRSGKRRTVDRIATVSDFTAVLQTTDTGRADFTNQGETTSAHHLIKEVGEGGLNLGDFLAVVTTQVL